MATGEEEILKQFLEREGVDVQRFIEEKKAYMERKDMLGRRRALVPHMTTEPIYVDVEGETRK